MTRGLAKNVEGGSVLLLSLWVLAFMALAAGSFAFRMGIERRLSQSLWKGMQLERVALLAAYVNGSPAEQEDAIRPPELGQTQVEKEDESGRINLNTASPEVLKRLFENQPDVVSAIVDWRTPLPTGQALSRRDREESTRGYTVRHGAFRSVEELLLVEGMTPDTYRKVAEHVTVFTSGPVNVNRASERVLEALGLPVSLARKILYYRQGRDGLDGTPDDRPFPDEGTLVDRLHAQSPLSEREKEALTSRLGQNLLGARSEGYRLRILARLPDPRASRRYVVVMSGQGKLGRILAWREF